MFSQTCQCIAGCIVQLENACVVTEQTHREKFRALPLSYFFVYMYVDVQLALTPDDD